MGIKADIDNFIKNISSLKINGLDSSILIYHLEDIRPYSELTEVLISALSSGLFKAIISTISITELMTKPYSEGDMKKILIFRRFLHSLSNTDMIAPDFDIADESARLRGKYRLRTPDAILLATVKKRRADAFITNDAHFKKINIDGIKIIFLDDYIK